MVVVVHKSLPCRDIVKCERSRDKAHGTEMRAMPPTEASHDAGVFTPPRPYNRVYAMNLDGYVFTNEHGNTFSFVDTQYRKTRWMLQC